MGSDLCNRYPIQNRVVAYLVEFHLRISSLALGLGHIKIDEVTSLMQLKTLFEFGDFFVMRTPFYPIDELVALAEGMECSCSTKDNAQICNESYMRDYDKVRERVRQITLRPDFQDALWLASNSFYSQLHCLEGNASIAKRERVERTLYRYFARMTSRPTPFGLFAGCSTGRFAEKTHLVLEPQTEYRTRSRLDMEHLWNMSHALARDSTYTERLPVAPNNTMYVVGKCYHYFRATAGAKGITYLLASVESTEYLSFVLNAASSTKCTAPELARSIVEQYQDVDLVEAREYITGLITEQILLPLVLPTVSGDNPLNAVIDHLSTYAADPEIVNRLRKVRVECSEVDAQSGSSRVPLYRGIAEAAASLPGDHNRDHLIQVDLLKPASQCTLAPDALDELWPALELLQCIHRTSTTSTTLSHFAAAYKERYEDQELPLAEVLDDDCGIGFEHTDTPSAHLESLLDDFVAGNTDSASPIEWSRWDTLMLQRLQAAWSAGDPEIALDTSEIAEFMSSEQAPLPPAFSVRIAISAHPSDRIMERPLIFLEGAIGASASPLLGRFCDADPLLLLRLRNHIALEEKTDDSEAIFAEIVHMPEGRMGNVICRPHLRDYEIPILSTSSLPPERQIPLSDLLVSIQGGRIRLRSRRLGGEVLPRLSSAHNFGSSRNLKVYKFLCVLQMQNTIVPNWDWGVLRASLYLPRVTLGRVVLARAQWRMPSGVVSELSHATGVERFRLTKLWQAKARVPRFVYLTEFDNELLIDFDNPLSIDTLVEYVKAKTNIVLTEPFPSFDNIPVRGPEGRFVHELIIPIVRRTHASKGAGYALLPCVEVRECRTTGVHREGDLYEPQCIRTFVPGSEWLYLKFYASLGQLDWLLQYLIEPIATDVIRAGFASKWFFLRYADPEPHLRVRFQGHSRTLLGNVLPLLNESATQAILEKRMWRMAVDQYQRETERYGGAVGILASEEIFFHDSVAVVSALGHLHDYDSRARWQAAFCGANILLEDFGMTLSDKIRFTTAIRDKIRRDKNGRSYTDRLSSRAYREHSLELVPLISGSTSDASAFPSAVFDVFKGRSHHIRHAVGTLYEEAACGRLMADMSPLIESIIHMHINRLLCSYQPQQEKVIYNLLLRSYTSVASRTAAQVCADQGIHASAN